MPRLKKLLKRPEIVFAIIAGFFGLISAFYMPILEVPDENQHFQVSYAIFSENQKAGVDLVLSDGMIIKEISNGNYFNYFTQKSSAQYDGFAINTSLKVFDGKTRASVFDVMRLPQAAGVLTGRAIYPSLGVMVTVGRLFVLATFIAAMYLIIKKVRYGKWIFAYIALLPIVIQQAASLSYDAINLIAVFAWVAFIINMYFRKSFPEPKHVLIGVALAILLFLSKANNLLLLALVFALPATQITGTELYRKVRGLNYWKPIKIILLICFTFITIVGLYIIQMRLLSGNPFNPSQIVSVLANTFFWGDLTLIDVTAIGTVGQFSNFYYHIPVWLVIITYAVLVVLLLNEKLPTVSKRFALLSAGLFMASVLAITIGMYYGWAIQPFRLGPGTLIADGIQGRYFTPLLILLFPLFAYLQRHIRIVTEKSHSAPALAMVFSLILLTLYIAQTWQVIWK
jgi:uncharacterized membrane protein